MKKYPIILFIINLLININGQAQTKPEQTIFAFGGDINPKLVQYVVDLTGKPNPKICYVPTASADNEQNIKYWNYICTQLSIESNVLKVWISSSSTTKTFEEILLSMDAIVVGGGNTLNMMGIWKAQDIDVVLKKALDKGIILAGGSAGSICWFVNGMSDSRPVQLSMVDGLGFLPYSHCPHYTDVTRKALYHYLIESKKIKLGYACDDLSGILFKNGKFIEAVSVNDINNSYYVGLKNGKIYSEKLKSRILIKKDALPTTAYTTTEVNKTVGSFPEISRYDTPLDAYISIIHMLANGRNSMLKQASSYALQERLSNSTDVKVEDESRRRFLNSDINKVLTYKDSLAGIITPHKDFYGLWYFYKENGKWMNAGEDIGGETLLEAEIAFREKASMHMEKIRKTPIN